MATPNDLPHDPLAFSADECAACRAEFIQSHHVIVVVDDATRPGWHPTDDGPDRPTLVDPRDCPGCANRSNNGADHTCGVW